MSCFRLRFFCWRSPEILSAEGGDFGARPLDSSAVSGSDGRREPLVAQRMVLRPLLVVVDDAKAGLSVNHGVRSHCERAPRPESEHLRHVVLRRAPTRNPRAASFA